jgi:hypothetical protein
MDKLCNTVTGQYHLFFIIRSDAEHLDGLDTSHFRHGVGPLTAQDAPRDPTPLSSSLEPPAAYATELRANHAGGWRAKLHYGDRVKARGFCNAYVRAGTRSPCWTLTTSTSTLSRTGNCKSTLSSRSWTRSAFPHPVWIEGSLCGKPPSSRPSSITAIRVQEICAFLEELSIGMTLEKQVFTPMAGGRPRNDGEGKGEDTGRLQSKLKTNPHSLICK